MRYVDAHDLFRTAARAQLGREPTADELRGLVIVSKQESDFGDAPSFGDSNNMGAVMAECGSPDAFKPITEPVTGKKQCLKKYESKFAGALDLVRELYQRRPSVLRAAQQRSIRDLVDAMRRTKYFVDFPDERFSRERVRQFTAIDREAARALKEAPWSSSTSNGGGGGFGLALFLLLVLGSRSRR